MHHGRWSQTPLSWDWSEVCFNDGSWVCVCVFSIHADERLFSAYIYCMSVYVYIRKELGSDFPRLAVAR